MIALQILNIQILFRRKPIRTSKNNSGSQLGSTNGGGGGKKGANKVAKPLSYDNYSTDTSSQFSADIVEVTGEWPPTNLWKIEINQLNY